MSSTFLNLEKAKHLNNSALESVVDNQGHHTSMEDVLSVIHDFYNNLYSNCDSKSDQDISEFLNRIPSLPHISQDVSGLMALISEDEILSAIKALRIGKAPGCDSLTAEFFKAFDVTIVPILVLVFHDVWNRKKMSDLQRLAVIILLFKKGNPQMLANYRPISLTNADYRILAYLLSNHLSTHLTDVISVNQTAYMPGQFIGANIRYVQDTIEYFVVNSPKSTLLFLDFKKAFDSISHKFLFALLSHIGCPSEFVAWVKIMYSDVTSSV